MGVATVTATPFYNELQSIPKEKELYLTCSSFRIRNYLFSS